MNPHEAKLTEAIDYALERIPYQPDGKSAEQWALTAAVLIDKKILLDRSEAK